MRQETMGHDRLPDLQGDVGQEDHETAARGREAHEGHVPQQREEQAEGGRRGDGEDRAGGLCKVRGEEERLRSVVRRGGRRERDKLWKK